MVFITSKENQYYMLLLQIITNKHVTFNKVQCIGHMEPPIDNISQTSVNSVITQKMMDKQVQLDTFKPLYTTFPWKITVSK